MDEADVNKRSQSMNESKVHDGDSPRDYNPEQLWIHRESKIYTQQAPNAERFSVWRVKPQWTI